MKKIIALGAVLSLLAGGAPAFAADIVVESNNNANVVNTVVSTANSGSNTANGAAADNATEGGNVTDSEYGNKAGNGDNTVLGGLGGTIQTGSATANASISNTLNTTRTRIVNTPWSGNNIRVGITHTVAVDNGASAQAASGDNTASGAAAGNVTVGGNVSSAGSSNTAGNSGNHVEGGGSGVISTGASLTNTSIVNILNRTITRVRN